MKKVSEIDDRYMKLAREHIESARAKLFNLPVSATVLEIGPRVHIRSGDTTWHTLDIVPGCTYQYDITKRTPLPDSFYDAVLCLEVLEHTLDPFAAIKEIRRVLKPGGMLVASTPFNARIHGPANDCWRFTEHGIKVLMRDWDDLKIESLESERFLCPIHYSWMAHCNKEKNVTDDEVTSTFRWIV